MVVRNYYISFSLLTGLAVSIPACGSESSPSESNGDVVCLPACGAGQECVSAVCQPMAGGPLVVGVSGAPAGGANAVVSLAGATSVAGAGGGPSLPATGGASSGGMPVGGAPASSAGMAAIAAVAGASSGGAAPNGSAGGGGAGNTQSADPTTGGSAPVGAAGDGGAAGDMSELANGGMGGVSVMTGGAGAASGGAAMLAAGGSGELAAGGAGLSEETPAIWHAAVSATVTDEMLQAEYDAWKAAHVVICDDSSASVNKGGGDVVSEGIAYGMLLSANMDDRPLFDQFWQFYSDHLGGNGLMDWQWGDVCAAPGSNGSNAATDAEIDAIMALLQANFYWPEGGYLAEAEALALKVLAVEVEVCSGRTILRPGDQYGGCSDMFSSRVNPSYFAPGYYRAYAHHFPEQAETWNALLEGTYELYPGYEGAASDGPYPDWSDVDGSPDGSSYHYDAARTPWRIATDYAWSGEARAEVELARVRAYVDSEGGIPVGSHDDNSTFSGAFALAAVPEQAKFDEYMAAWLASTGDDAPYFQGTLRVLYLLLAGGRFPSTL